MDGCGPSHTSGRRMARHIRRELRRAIKQIVRGVRDSRFLADSAAWRLRSAAADCVQSLDEVHRREQTIAAWDGAEREPLDRRRIDRAAIQHRADDLAAAVALPARTREVRREL